MSDPVVGGGGVSEDAVGFDSLAASLRGSSADMGTFVEVLADKLVGALPGRVRVERRAVRFLSKEKRVERVEVDLGENRYVLVMQGGVIEARCAKCVRGVVLKSELLPLERWIDALARDLAAEAEASDQSRLALEQLLGG